MNWIPMKEKQPTKEGYYMVSLDSGCVAPLVDTDYWDDLGEFWDHYGTNVNAWTELPEPYKEEQG